MFYLGCGAGKGKIGYEGHGLGSRLQAYIGRDRSKKVTGGQGKRFLPKPIADGTAGVHTIGFPVGRWYLAPALEAFLIDRLRP